MCILRTINNLKVWHWRSDYSSTTKICTIHTLSLSSTRKNKNILKNFLWKFIFNKKNIAQKKFIEDGWKFYKFQKKYCFHIFNQVNHSNFENEWIYCFFYFFKKGVFEKNPWRTHRFNKLFKTRKFWIKSVDFLSVSE